MSPCLFNFYAGVDEAQARINIAGRNINNLRYADDTTLMAENEEELKSLLMKVKEDESVLMRWMKLEPIIQSEVSQKEKHQYSILTHIYGI